jgi:hypothetical protein
VNVDFALRAVPFRVVAALGNALGAATAETRIYLRGHGNWQLTTLGGWGPKAVALLLRVNGLANARVISITGCNAARAASLGEPERPANLDFPDMSALAARQLAATLDSFAGCFHKRLAYRLPLAGAPLPPITGIPVTARMYSVTVDDDGRKRLAIGEVGREMKRGSGSARWGKVQYRQVHGSQQASWVFGALE